MTMTINKGKRQQWNIAVLALGMIGSVFTPVWAGSTPTTSPVWGSAPVLSAISNGQPHSVDFSGTFATPGELSTGDTIVMTYHYTNA